MKRLLRHSQDRIPIGVGCRARLATTVVPEEVALTRNGNDLLGGRDGEEGSVGLRPCLDPGGCPPDGQVLGAPVFPVFLARLAGCRERAPPYRTEGRDRDAEQGEADLAAAPDVALPWGGLENHDRDIVYNYRVGGTCRIARLT